MLFSFCTLEEIVDDLTVLTQVNFYILDKERLGTSL
jgi:hypothetical protein